MSRDDAIEFVRVLQTAKAAQGMDRGKLPDLANEALGLEFDETELSEVMDALEGDSDELDEDQLEQAAGGMSVLNADPDGTDLEENEPGRATTLALGEEGGSDLH